MTARRKGGVPSNPFSGGTAGILAVTLATVALGVAAAIIAGLVSWIW